MSGMYRCEISDAIIYIGVYTADIGKWYMVRATR